MAIKQFKEIRDLTVDELKTKLRDAEAELFQTRMQKQTGQLDNTGKLWALRKYIARTKTLLTQKAEKKAARPDVVAAN